VGYIGASDLTQLVDARNFGSERWRFDEDRYAYPLFMEHCL